MISRRTQSTMSSATFDYANWKHLVVSVDHTLGTMKIYEDGNQTATQSFTVEESANKIIGQDWYFGQGLVPSSFDEMRLAVKSIPADWIYTEFINQKQNSSFPSITSVNGAPSFTSVSKFSLVADQLFDHQVSVTSAP